MAEEKLFTRELKKELLKYLNVKEAIIILGSRQVGKTSLLKLLMQEIGAFNKTFYFDLEDPRLLEIAEQGPQSFLEYLFRLGLKPGERGYIFFDEIHYLKSPAKFIKLLVDHYSHYLKIFATGSSALGIKIKFHDALVGRKLIFHLYPLSFQEFLIFKGREDLAGALPSEPFSQKEDPTRFFHADYLRFFQEFLIFGGYPRVVLENDWEKKEKLLGEIVGAYIYKDIRSLFQIGDVTKFNHLSRLVAATSGSLLNLTNLAGNVGLSRQTVSNYLAILENSFLIAKLPAFSRSRQVEVRKTPKIYWLDNGLRNYLIGDLSYSLTRADIGILLESAVFGGLLKRKKEIDYLGYWRTKDKTEVDFIYQRQGKIIPVEVKSLARPHRGLISFMKKYKLKRGFQAHLGDFRLGEISFLPVFWLT